MESRSEENDIRTHFDLIGKNVVIRLWTVDQSDAMDKKSMDLSVIHLLAW
jgi:hypothetical protein